MHPRIVILLLAPEESPPRRSCPMAAKWAAQGVETNSKTGPESRPGAIGAASLRRRDGSGAPRAPPVKGWRSEEHTSELQSLMRISYAVFYLNKKKHTLHTTNTNHQTKPPN